MKLWRFLIAVTAVVAMALLGAVALAQSGTDYDADDDGLIEITSAAQLNAIRYDLDGDGTPASANASDYSSAFPNAVEGMGCPSSGCTGYELTDRHRPRHCSVQHTATGWEPTSPNLQAYLNGGEGWRAYGGLEERTVHCHVRGQQSTQSPACS